MPMNSTPGFILPSYFKTEAELMVALQVSNEKAGFTTELFHSDATGEVIPGSRTILVEDFFEHHGIKGMKWGVHKSETVETGPAPAKPVASSADSKAADRSLAKVDAHGTRVLSNEDLQKLVTRLNLEQQYDRLSSEPSVAPGKSEVDRILANANKAQIIYKHLDSKAARKFYKYTKDGYKLGKRVYGNRTARAAAGVALALI